MGRSGGRGYNYVKVKSIYYFIFYVEFLLISLVIFYLWNRFMVLKSRIYLLNEFILNIEIKLKFVIVFVIFYDEFR